MAASDESEQASLRGRAAWILFDFDNEARLFRCSEYSGLERAEQARELGFRLGEEPGLVGLVAARNAALYVPDVEADARWMALDTGVTSAYFAPIASEAQVIGVFVVLGRARAGLDSTHCALADLFARERGKLWRLARDGAENDSPGDGSNGQALDLSGLSQRERDVVNALCRGLRLTDIARVLGISNHTARNHLKHVFRKLGVHSQVELLSTIGRPLGTR